MKNKLKIFVISLIESTDRQNYIKNQLNNLNISYEIFNAVDGRKLSQNDKDELYNKDKAIKYTGNELTPGEIGCSLSHKAVYKKMIEEDIERAVILEDDIILRPDFNTIVPYFDNISLKGYVIKLERAYGSNKSEDNIKTTKFTLWHKKNINNDYFIGQPLFSPYLTWGYYIDKIAAKALYKSMPKVYLTADKWVYHRKYIKLRMLNKPIITDNYELFNSIIGENNNKTVMKNNIFLKFKLLFKYILLIFN